MNYDIVNFIEEWGEGVKLLTRKRILASATAVVLLAGTVLAFRGNFALEQNLYVVSSDELPSGFDGFRIAHISDLHNTQMATHNERLLEMLRSAKPDVIAITGDLVDSRKTNLAVALHFVSEAVKIAPCYYVTGNHETRIDEYEQLKARIIRVGAVVLEDTKVKIWRKGETITLAGLNDPGMYKENLYVENKDVVDRKLSTLCANDDGYTVLLSHRPEMFETYARYDLNLVLCGHAHGGQIRLPQIGGLFAPGQGFLPAYDAGEFSRADTTMIISRGIGNSIFPIRINNPPELVIVQLQGL